MVESKRARSLHLQTLGGSVLLLAIPIFIGIVMWLLAIQADRREQSVLHTLQVELSVQSLVSDVRTAESNQRAFLLTGNQDFSSSSRSAAAAARSEMDRLSALTKDNQQQQATLSRLRPVLERRFADLAAATTQKPDSGAAGVPVKDQIGRVQALANEMFQQEERLLLQRQKALRTATSRFYWILYLGYGLIVLVVALLYRSVMRHSIQSAQAEERLTALNSELDERIRQRTALLRAREELLNIFVRHVPAAVAMLDREMRFLQVSDRWCADYEIERERFIGQSHLELFPDIPQRWKAIHQRCLEGETLHADEDLWERNGRTLRLRWEIRPWGNRNGMPEGILVFTENITARKEAEAKLIESERKLRELAGELLTAQEEERRKLARELHDDVTQQLAFLSIELGRLAGELPEPMSEVRTRIKTLQKQTFRASSEIRRISHGLHPSVITDFGLSVALEEFCEEFEKAHQIKVVFEASLADSRLNDAEATCLYRIAQESMRNSVVHGHATEVDVTLHVGNGAMQLRVQDNGTGTSGNHGRHRTGLGMVSMMERVRLVNGTVHMAYEPGHGTTITASVPLMEGRDDECKDSDR